MLALITDGFQSQGWLRFTIFFFVCFSSVADRDLFVSLDAVLHPVLFFGQNLHYACFFFSFRTFHYILLRTVSQQNSVLLSTLDTPFAPYTPTKFGFTLHPSYALRYFFLNSPHSPHRLSSFHLSSPRCAYY